MKFKIRIFAIFIILFLIEVIIAKYITQPFIRHWFGDFLVVIMLYYFFKSFVNTRPVFLALFVLIFAFVIEFIQLTNLLDILKLKDNKTANLILGNTFSISDLIAYTLGILTVYYIDKKKTIEN
tara:strand:- start:437370 stop:437741 length:372 start_codon:yes stop_codon:yes gene_type:complete